MALRYPLSDSTDWSLEFLSYAIAWFICHLSFLHSLQKFLVELEASISLIPYRFSKDVEDVN